MQSLRQPLLFPQHHLPHKPLTSSSPLCALTKRGQNFLTAITTTRDPAAKEIIITKFVKSCPEPVVLTTLSYILSPQQPKLSFLALPLYTKITEARWFSWNSKLVANIVAVLYEKGKVKEAEALISETVLRCSKERDLVSFYKNLMSFVTQMKLTQGFSDTRARLYEILCSTASAYVRKRAYEGLVGGLCVMGLPEEAEKLISETRHLGLKPTLFEFRSLVVGYGRLRLFDKMLQVVVEMESSGYPLDTITSNMVLSSYAEHNELSEMVLWVQKAKNLGISFSIRTYNTILNSCPTLMSLLKDLSSVPLSVKELLGVLVGHESWLVQELIGSSVLTDIITWDSLESKLDLHGMHLATSYLILLQWMEELRRRFTSEQYIVPAEIIVVCGLGKHSNRGYSIVKTLLGEITLRTKSPLRILQNNGCFVAKGKAVKDWLTTYLGSSNCNSL